MGVIAALTAAAVLSMWLWGAAAGAGDAVTAAEAYDLSASGRAVLVDVRTPAEWRDTGIPAGARKISLRHPRGPAGFLQDILEAVGGDRDRPVVLICARGNRSARAAALLEANGFKRVHDVTAGMLGRDEKPGWIGSGLPREPCETC